MDEETYYETVRPYLEKAIQNDYDLKQIAKIIQPRIDHLEQIEEAVDFFDVLPDYDLQMYKHKKMKTTLEIALKSLKAVEEELSALSDWSSEQVIHDMLLALPKKMEMKNGQVLWPVRTALTGKQFTPGGAIEIAYILGKDESLNRIRTGIERLEKELESAK